MSPDSQFDQLKSAVQGAQQQGAPASPLGNFPELAKLYSSSFQLPGVQAAGNATANLASDVTAEQQATAKAQAKSQADKLDPNKYTQVPKADGGYSFLDPSGQEVSAYQYARITGQSLDKVLNQSENPIDQGFVNDYKNLQDYLGAWVNKDQAAIDAAQAENPALKDIKTPQQLTELFKQHYPTVFGGTQNGNQPVTSTLVPNSQVAAANNAGGATPIGG